MNRESGHDRPRAAVHHAASIGRDRHWRRHGHSSKDTGVGFDHTQCAPGRRALRNPRRADPARARAGGRPAATSSSSTSATPAATVSRRRRTCARRSPATCTTARPTATSRGWRWPAKRSPRSSVPAAPGGVDAGADLHRQRRQRADRHLACAPCCSPATRCCCPARTTRCGAPPPSSTAASRATTAAWPSNGHLPDPDEVEALITPRTRALVLINPNNPTGAVYPRELLERLVAIAARHRLLLLSDEIYDEILYDERHLPAAGRGGRRACRASASAACQQGASRLRLPGRLDEPVRRSGPHRRLPRCPAIARRAAPVRQRHGAVGGAAGAAERTDHRRADRARRPPARGASRRARGRGGQRVSGPGGTRRRAVRLPAGARRSHRQLRRRAISPCACWRRNRCWWCRAAASTCRPAAISG